MRFAPALVVGLGLFVVACAPSTPAPAPSSAPAVDLAAEEKAIRDLDARWAKAVQARDVAAEVAMFAPDGMVYRQHNPPLDRTAFEAFETKFFADNPKSSGGWETTGVHVAAAGDMAIQTGQYNTTGLGPMGQGADKGSFVTVWKKVNGEWKVAHDISTTTMPEAPKP